MPSVLPQNEKYLRDAFGSPLHDGACVLDSEHQVGYVRLEFGTRRGPDSARDSAWAPIKRGPHFGRSSVARG